MKCRIGISSEDGYDEFSFFPCIIIRKRNGKSWTEDRFLRKSGRKRLMILDVPESVIRKEKTGT